MNTQKRIKCNTESLKKQFTEDYREFFSKSSVIVSASGSFHFVGDQSARNGGMSIIQKLPLKSYVGLEIIEDGQIEEGEVKYFESPFGKIEKEIYFDESNFEILKNLIQFELKRYSVNKGYRINIFCEMPTKCGINSSGSISSSLAAAILLDNNIISVEEIENFKNQSFVQLQKNKNFNLIFNLARKIHATMRSGRSSGSGVFSSMATNLYPIIYFIEKNNSADPRNVNNNFEEVKYHAFKLQDLLGFEKRFVWPFDFGLIYTGHTKSSSIVSCVKDGVKSFFGEVEEFNKNIFKDKLTKEEISQVFLCEELDCKKNDYWKTIMQLSSYISMECLQGLCRLFSGRIDSFTLTAFFKSLNRYYYIYSFLSLTNVTMNRIRAMILGKATVADEILGGAVKACGSGMGGDLLFVIPRGHFPTTIINEIVEKINKRLQRNDIGIDYASWLDGTESKGLEVHQFLSKKIYSEFVSRGSVILENIEKNKKFIEVISKQELEDRLRELDVLVDLVSGHIYLNGKKMKSDEVPSAITSSKILVKLLDSQNYEISNQDLEESSYAEDRNIFQGKIVTPLVKVIKKYCHKEIDFKLSGKITNFKIKIDLDGLKIGVVRKII